MSRKMPLLLMSIMALLAVIQPSSQAHAIVIEPFYAGSYSFTDLGAVPGLPTPYGGLTIKQGDPNTLLIGGAANIAGGRIHSIGVVRGPGNHVTGFSGSASALGFGTFNDGGVGFGPGGVLFLAQWPVNKLGQVKPGSLTEDKIIDLTAKGVVPNASISAQNFVPVGFPGAGQMKLVTWEGGSWYTAAFSPDGSGTFNIDSVTHEDLNAGVPGIQDLPGGPEGFVYVPPGSALFADFDSLLLSEFSSGNIVTYTLDAKGNPEMASRKVFISGLTGAEGAAVDPLTGDFLFSTFGAAEDHVIVVQGFVPPQQEPPGVPEPGTLFLVGSGLVALAGLPRRRRCRGTLRISPPFFRSKTSPFQAMANCPPY